jgi:hypothetical protein
MLVWYPAPGHEPTHPIYSTLGSHCDTPVESDKPRKPCHSSQAPSHWTVPPHSCSCGSPPANKLLLGCENKFITPQKYTLITNKRPCEYVDMCTNVCTHAHTYAYTMTTWLFYSSETFLNTPRSKNTYLQPHKSKMYITDINIWCHTLFCYTKLHFAKCPSQ